MKHAFLFRASGAALDLRIEVLMRPIGLERLQSGILVPLPRGRLQLDQCLLGGGHLLFAPLFSGIQRNNGT